MRVLDAASPFWVLKALVRAVIMLAGFGGAAADAASFVAICEFSSLSVVQLNEAWRKREKPLLLP